MGYASLSAEAKGNLQEIARMAYGSGRSEKKSGGMGHMGLLVDEEGGTTRVVKFNTHRSEYRATHSPQDLQSMVESSNRLRAMLIDISEAACLSPDELARIRARLGLPEGANQAETLLERKAVADVVSLIGGDAVWNDALAVQGGIGTYRSEKVTLFTRLSGRNIAAGNRNVKEVTTLKQPAADLLKRVGEEWLRAHSDSTWRHKIGDVYGALVSAAFETELLNEGYFKAMSEGTVRQSLLRVFDEVAEAFDQMGVPPDAPGKLDEFVAFAKDRMRVALKGDDYMLMKDGGFTMEEVGLLKAHGLDPEKLLQDKGVVAAMEKFGFNAVERRKIVTVMSAYLVADLERLAPGERPAMAEVLKDMVRMGTYGGLVAGMLLCDGEPDIPNRLNRIRNDRDRDFGTFGADKAAKTLAYFNALSGIEGLKGDLRSRWKAFAEALQARGNDGNELHELLSVETAGDAFALRMDVAGDYVRDVEAVKNLNAEIDVDQNLPEDIKQLLRVPRAERSIGDFIGEAKQEAFRAPYARYRFEMAKRILDFVNENKEEIFKGSANQSTSYVVKSLMKWDFDSVPKKLKAAAKAFMSETSEQELWNLGFSAYGKNKRLGATFGQAVENALSDYPEEKRGLCRDILRVSFRNHLLGNGSGIGDEKAFQNAIDRLFGRITKLGAFLHGTPAEALKVIARRGENEASLRNGDLLSVLNEMSKVPPAVTGLLLSKLMPGNGDFAGSETNLANKIRNVYGFLTKRENLPDDLKRFVPQNAKLLAIVACTDQKIDKLLSKSELKADDEDVRGLFGSLRQNMEKVVATVDAMAMYMAEGETGPGDALKPKLFEKLHTFGEDCAKFCSVIGPSGAGVDGLLDLWKRQYEPFRKLRDSAKGLDRLMRRRRFASFDTLKYLLGETASLQDLFLKESFLASGAKRVEEAEKTIDYRRKAVERYAAMETSPQQKRVAGVMLQILGLPNMAVLHPNWPGQPDPIAEFHQMLLEECEGANGLFADIDRTVREINGTKSARSKAGILIGLIRRLALRIVDRVDFDQPFNKRAFGSGGGVEDRTVLRGDVLYGLVCGNPALNELINGLMRTNSNLVSGLLAHHAQEGLSEERETKVDDAVEMFVRKKADELGIETGS